MIKAGIKNGRLIITSVTEEGSIKLDKWIEENKKFLNRNLDIEILAK